jgi:hypothetical protein
MCIVGSIWALDASAGKSRFFETLQLSLATIGLCRSDRDRNSDSDYWVNPLRAGEGLERAAWLLGFPFVDRIYHCSRSSGQGEKSYHGGKVRIEVGTRRNEIRLILFFTTKTRKYESSKESKMVGEKHLFRGFVLSRFRGEKAFDLFFAGGRRRFLNR